MIDYVYDCLHMDGPMLIFEIFGKPEPQKQTQFAVVKPEKYFYSAPRKRVKAYNPSKLTEKMIKWQLGPQAPKDPLQGAIGMDLLFYLPIPKHVSKTTRNLMINGAIRPIVRPDFDNLAYVVTNSMKNLIYRDDSQVVRCLIEKYYSENPRTVIRVWEI